MALSGTGWLAFLTSPPTRTRTLSLTLTRTRLASFPYFSLFAERAPSASRLPGKRAPPQTAAERAAAAIAAFDAAALAAATPAERAAARAAAATALAAAARESETTTAAAWGAISSGPDWSPEVARRSDEVAKLALTLTLTLTHYPDPDANLVSRLLFHVLALTLPLTL